MASTQRLTIHYVAMTGSQVQIHVHEVLGMSRLPKLNDRPRSSAVYATSCVILRRSKIMSVRPAPAPQSEMCSRTFRFALWCLCYAIFYFVKFSHSKYKIWLSKPLMPCIIYSHILKIYFVKKCLETSKKSINISQQIKTHSNYYSNYSHFSSKTKTKINSLQ